MNETYRAKYFRGTCFGALAWTMTFPNDLISSECNCSSIGYASLKSLKTRKIYLKTKNALLTFKQPHVLASHLIQSHCFTPCSNFSDSIFASKENVDSGMKSTSGTWSNFLVQFSTTVRANPFSILKSASLASKRFCLLNVRVLSPSW